MADTQMNAQASTCNNNDDSAYSWNEILRVQNLIERCLQQSMSQAEILNALQMQANIDPNFTRTVWQKLEEQNPSFFEAYTLHLMLKEQIISFNYLVNQQREMERSQGDMKIPIGNPTLNRLSTIPILSPIKTDLDTCAFFT